MYEFKPQQLESIKESLTKQGYFTNLSTTVECTCGECFEVPEDILTYECEFCDREVPWCFGMGDQFESFCDDCAMSLGRITGVFE